MGAFKLQQMVNMHWQLSFRGSREYKISYFWHKISTFDYFYGGNLVKMGVYNWAKDKNAHFGGLDWKERLKWTRYIYVGEHYSLEMKFYEVTGAERQLRSMQASWKKFLVHLLGTQLPAEFSTQQISLIHVTFVCKDKRIRSILPLNHWMREACTK